MSILTQSQVKELKQAIKEMKNYLIELDNLSYRYIKTYKDAYKYSDAFDLEYNKIKLFTKKLDSNQKIDDNIYICDQLVYGFKLKFGINIRDFDSFTNKNYLSIYLDNELDDYKQNKIDVIIKAFRNS